MAFVPYTLKSPQTFTRTNSNQQVTIEAETTVQRETTESATHTFHHFRITRDGSYWHNTISIPKEQPQEQEEPEDLGDEVPTCPLCNHHPMVRNSKDSGWRCGTPGNRWDNPTRKWSHCQGVIWDNQQNNTPSPAAVVAHATTSGVEVVYNPPTNGNGHANMSSQNSTTKAIIGIAKREGINLTTGEQMELDVRRSERILDILSGEVYRVNYYIPDQLKKKVRNPSYIFRRYAYRLDGSNWVFSTKGLEQKKVQEWIKFVEGMKPVIDETEIDGTILQAEVCAEVWIDPYVKEERAKMREKIMRRLSQQLIQCHKSLIKRLDSAGKAVEKAREKLGMTPTANAQASVEAKHATRLRAVVEDACIKYEMALRGAEIFDDTGRTDAMFEALRNVVFTQTNAVNVLLQMRGMKQVKIPKTISTPPVNSIKVDSKSINPQRMPDKKKD